MDHCLPDHVHRWVIYCWHSEHTRGALHISGLAHGASQGSDNGYCERSFWDFLVIRHKNLSLLATLLRLSRSPYPHDIKGCPATACSFQNMLVVMEPVSRYVNSRAWAWHGSICMASSAAMQASHTNQHLLHPRTAVGHACSVEPTRAPTPPSPPLPRHGCRHHADLIHDSHANTAGPIAQRASEACVWSGHTERFWSIPLAVAPLCCAVNSACCAVCEPVLI